MRSAGTGRQRSGGEQPTDYSQTGETASERRYEEARRRLPEKVDRMFADAEWLRNIYEQGHTPLSWQKGQSTPESFAHCIEHIKRWFVQQVVCKGNPADSLQRLRYYFFNLMNPGSKTREECRHYVSDLLQHERSLAAEGKTANDGYD